MVQHAADEGAKQSVHASSEMSCVAIHLYTDKSSKSASFPQISHLFPHFCALVTKQPGIMNNDASCRGWRPESASAMLCSTKKKQFDGHIYLLEKRNILPLEQ
jgi:hypothetical protein